MRLDFQFSRQMLDSVVGGVSALDIPRLEVSNLDEARNFVRSYGYDLSTEEGTEHAWNYHRKAVAFLKDHLLNEGEEIPEILSDPNQLKDVGYLLVYASTKEHKDNKIQLWACTLLRVMHTFVHLDNDLFNFFSDEIQSQILEPIRRHIFSDPVAGSDVIGNKTLGEAIRLHRFEVKPFKTTASSIVKLLAKPEAVSFRLLDKLGVRFVTRSVFDAFRVIRYLVRQHIVSFPHIISDQSTNTLFPVNVLVEALEAFEKSTTNLSSEDVDRSLKEKLNHAQDRAQYQLRENAFSGDGYQFLKFINRQRIFVKLATSDEPLHFFYPYEIQIMDYQTYLRNISGPAAHDKYKERQRKAARARVFGLPVLMPQSTAKKPGLS